MTTAWVIVLRLTTFMRIITFETRFMTRFGIRDIWVSTEGYIDMAARDEELYIIADLVARPHRTVRSAVAVSAAEGAPADTR